MLSQLQRKYGNKIGLYRNDGLSFFGETPRQTKKAKEEITKIFKENELKITVEAY